MSTTEVTVTSPTDPQSVTSPLMQAVDSAAHQGARAIRSQRQPREWKLVAIRDCPTPAQVQECDTPERAAEYWRLHVQTNPYFNPEVEFFVVLMLNTRRRIKGHTIVGMGILDSVLVHPREIFRVAIVASAHAVILMHNHPGGDPSPSTADLRTTRDLIRAGQLLRIEVLDHVIIGQSAPDRARHYSSLKELGHWAAA